MNARIHIKKLPSGFALPALGIGTWMIGGGNDRDLSNDDEENVNAILRAIDCGLVHIDTAELYAGGYCERLVGQAISRRPRSSLIIASKVMPIHLHHAEVIRSANQSLERLGTKYLDLYMIHRPNPDIEMEETFDALNELVNSKLVKYIGVSNFSVDRLREAQLLSDAPIVVNQVHYNLLVREPELTGLVRYCQERNILLVAWRPLEKGKIMHIDSALMSNLCAKYKKTKAQIAINWLISQPNVVTISTMRKPEHLAENLGGIGWSLEPQDIELLRDEFPGQMEFSEAVPLA